MLGLTSLLRALDACDCGSPWRIGPESFSSMPYEASASRELRTGELVLGEGIGEQQALVYSSGAFVFEFTVGPLPSVFMEHQHQRWNPHPSGQRAQPGDPSPSNTVSHVGVFCSHWGTCVSWLCGLRTGSGGH